MILGASIPKDRSRGFLIGCNQGIELLMICQSSKVHMKSVEFQRELFEVTQYNTEKSKFHDRVTLKFGELRQGFQEKDKGEFDLVVSNPFSPCRKSQATELDNDMEFHDLFNIAEQLLSRSGVFYLLIPPSKLKRARSQIEKSSLYVSKILHIKTRSSKPPKALILIVSRECIDKEERDEIVVYEGDSKEYTNKIVRLLDPYLLNIKD